MLYSSRTQYSICIENGQCNDVVKEGPFCMAFLTTDPAASAAFLLSKCSKRNLAGKVFFEKLISDNFSTILMCFPHKVWYKVSIEMLFRQQPLFHPRKGQAKSINSFRFIFSITYSLQFDGRDLVKWKTTVKCNIRKDFRLIGQFT